MTEPRPDRDILFSTTHRVSTGCGTMFITVCRDDQGITDIMIRIGKSGGCINSQTEVISNLLSTALRHGIAPEALIEDLIGTRCHQPVYQFGEPVLSCGDAIGKFLKHYLENNLYAPPEGVESNDDDLVEDIQIDGEEA